MYKYLPDCYNDCQNLDADIEGNELHSLNKENHHESKML